MIKGDPNEEIQFLGAVLIVALVLGALGFAAVDIDNLGYASAVLAEKYAPKVQLPGYCEKKGDDSIYVKNTVSYRDFNGDRKTVDDTCRAFDSGVLVEYGCKGDQMVSTDIHCEDHGATRCSDGRCIR